MSGLAWARAGEVLAGLTIPPELQAQLKASVAALHDRAFNEGHQKAKEQAWKLAESTAHDIATLRYLPEK